TRTPCVYVQAGAGGMLTLRSFAAAAGPEQPFYGLQAYNEEEPTVVPPVREVAAECLSLVRHVQPHGPYVLAGHSIGGHIAFEMACRLQAEGQHVALLALLDAQAPHTTRGWRRLAIRAGEFAGVGPEGRRDTMRRDLFRALRRAAVR